MRTTLPPERPPKSGSWNCVGDIGLKLSKRKHPHHLPCHLYRHARDRTPPVLTLSTESDPLMPSCPETGCSGSTGEKSPLRGTPKEETGQKESQLQVTHWAKTHSHLTKPAVPRSIRLLTEMIHPFPIGSLHDPGGSLTPSELIREWSLCTRTTEPHL